MTIWSLKTVCKRDFYVRYYLNEPRSFSAKPNEASAALLPLRLKESPYMGECDI